MRNFILLTLFTLGSFCAQAQVQTIPLHGTVTDVNGEPVSNACIKLYFSNRLLAQTYSLPDGSYHFTDTYYGKAREVDVEVEGYYGYKKLTVQNIPLSNVPLSICFGAETAGELLVYGRQEAPTVPAPDYFRRRLRYSKLANKAPLLYYDKIYHHILVKDTDGQAVPNAHVRIAYRGEKSHWGTTDSTGRVNVFAQFGWAAGEGRMYIKAAGYRSRHILLLIFDPVNEVTYTLRPKR